MLNFKFTGWFKIRGILEIRNILASFYGVCFVSGVKIVALYGTICVVLIVQVWCLVWCILMLIKFTIKCSRAGWLAKWLIYLWWVIISVGGNGQSGAPFWMGKGQREYKPIRCVYFERPTCFYLMNKLNR